MMTKEERELLMVIAEMTYNTFLATMTDRYIPGLKSFEEEKEVYDEHVMPVINRLTQLHTILANKQFATQGKRLKVNRRTQTKRR
jgi:hypothetical protein